MFYESAYYDLIRKGERAPDLARQLLDDPEARLDLEWLRSTVFCDLVDLAQAHNGGAGTVVDVGAGLGYLVESFEEAGWTAIGLEPAIEIAEVCRRRGLNVVTQTLGQFVEETDTSVVDVLILRLVLEHVRNPAELLETARKGLRDGGLIVVEVPNDFNLLQVAAQDALDLDQWWVTAPDHINYFDFKSLEHLLEGVGFRVIHRSTSYPMELFLLMGDDYVSNPITGLDSHRRRRNFEMRVDPELRRSIYQGLAAIGLGRTCLVAAEAA